MAILNATNPRFMVTDNQGKPLVGGLVYFYEAGTSTPIITYTDSVKTAQNTTPIVLDETGGADIWFEQAAKIDVKTSSGAQLDGFPVDNIAANLTTAVTGNFNLVKNGSFEIDENVDGEPDDWLLTTETNGVIANDSTVQVHGRNSLKFTSSGSGAGNAISASFDVHSGGDLSVKVTYKSTSATTQNLVQLVYFDVNSLQVGSDTLLNDSTTNPLSFTEFSYTSTVPATAVTANLSLSGVFRTGTTLAGSTWFDDIIVTAVDDTLVTLTAAQTVSNKTLESPVIDTAVSGSAIDIDGTLAANSDTLLASQKAIKTYVTVMEHGSVVNSTTFTGSTGLSFTKTGTGLYTFTHSHGTAYTVIARAQETVTGGSTVRIKNQCFVHQLNNTFDIRSYTTGTTTLVDSDQIDFILLVH